MRRWLLAALCGLLPVSGFVLPGRADDAAAPRRPNVLFLFTDDQRADTIAALGNPSIKTPALDRLVESGFVLTSAYCMGSNRGAVCLPSRNMLLSGRAYFRYERMASAAGPSFPKSMNEAGYETYHHGKRGNVAREIHTVFDHSKYLDDRQSRTSGEPGRIVVDEAVNFLDARSGEKPFFMYLAFANPHDPRVAAEKYRRLYRRDLLPLPPNYLPYHPFDNGELTVRDERLAPWPRTTDVVRRHLHDYYATITALDHHIGRLLKHLKETGRYENTLIVFSSDHGLAVGSHGLFGKQSLYEHSMKAPLLLAGPGIPHGRSDALLYLLDIFPTVCDLVGAPVPEGLDGRSFAPVVRGERTTHRESIFTAYRDVQRAVRTKEWKLIRYPRVDRTQLFHLRHDPYEQVNLADNPAHANRVQRLTELLREQQRRFGDEAPLSVDAPRPAEVDVSFFPHGGG